jgi:hypothetical protein
MTIFCANLKTGYATDNMHFIVCLRINPYQWLADTLKKIASHPINRIEELLPGWKPEKTEAAD